LFICWHDKSFTHQIKPRFKQTVHFFLLRTAMYTAITMTTTRTDIPTTNPIVSPGNQRLSINELSFNNIDFVENVFVLYLELLIHRHAVLMLLRAIMPIWRFSINYFTYWTKCTCTYYTQNKIWLWNIFFVEKYRIFIVFDYYFIDKFTLCQTQYIFLDQFYWIEWLATSVKRLCFVLL